MPAQPFRLAVITGSVREGRFGPTVTRWFTYHAGQREDLTVDVIDLADFLPPTVSQEGRADLARRLAEADAFVVVTPEYNHSFPAALKNAIDWYNKEWHAKPVGFVSYGGLSGGLRAVEHLRAVFAELHAVTIRDTISFHNAWSQFDDQGNAANPAECDTAAKNLLNQLTWWARALREARATHPYAA